MTHARILLHPEAQALLGVDISAAVKSIIMLAVRGGRLPPARCLRCGQRTRFVAVFVPPALLAPVPGPGRPRLYRVCRECRPVLTPADIEALLGERVEPA